MVQKIKINIALHGGTIKSILESGAPLAMKINAGKNKKAIK